MDNNDLRNEFATAFMQAVISSDTLNDYIEKDEDPLYAIAVDAYEMADNMVKVALKNPTTSK